MENNLPPSTPKASSSQPLVEPVKPRNPKALLISLVVLQIITLSVAGYFGYQYIQQNKQVTKTQPTPSLKTNGTLNQEKSDSNFNTNLGVNPTYISTLMNLTKLSSVISERDFVDKPFNTNVFITSDGKYQFEYPSFMSVYELPREYDSTADYVMVTQNNEDVECVNNLKKCIDERTPDSETICEIPLGDNYIISMGDPIDGFFFEDSRPGYTPPEFSKIEMDEGEIAYLTSTTVFLTEKILDTLESQSSIQLQVTDPPVYEYKLKLREPTNSSTDLRLVGYAYPITWPYRQTISSIIKSFKKL
ncbi:hypothetical protein ACFL1Q_01085 [Patescibacteria group bacterium]